MTLALQRTNLPLGSGHIATNWLQILDFISKQPNIFGLAWAFGRELALKQHFDFFYFATEGLVDTQTAADLIAGIEYGAVVALAEQPA